MKRQRGHGTWGFFALLFAVGLIGLGAALVFLGVWLIVHGVQVLS